MQKPAEDIQVARPASERTASGATELSATTDQLSSATADISSGAEQQRLGGGAVRIMAPELAFRPLPRSIRDSLRPSSSRITSRTSAEGAHNVQQASTQAMEAILDSSQKVGRITGVT